MKYGLDEMSPAIEIEDDTNTSMSRRSSTSSENSFEIVSAETCESPKNEMSSSFIPSVTFGEMFDIYPMDSDVIARISYGDNFQNTPDDIVVVLPMSWATVEQAVCISKVVDGYVRFDVNELPKDDRCCYQLCYCATERKTVVGVSIPFSFREVREEELMDFQKESNKEFYTFRSRFAILMDIHWNTLLHLKDKNLSSTAEIEKSANSSLGSFVDMQESIRLADDEPKLINDSRFTMCTNGTGSGTGTGTDSDNRTALLEALIDDDNVREQPVESVYSDDRWTDKLITRSLNKLTLDASVDIGTSTTDNSLETRATASTSNEHAKNSFVRVPVPVRVTTHPRTENIATHGQIEVDRGQKKSSSTTSFESSAKSQNTCAICANTKLSEDSKQAAIAEISKPASIEMVPDANEMYCSAKDFQEFENMQNNEFVENDTRKRTEKSETDVADSQIKDFMTEVTRLIETDYLYHQLNEYKEQLERLYQNKLDAYISKEKASRDEEPELARKLVNMTIEKQNILQSYVEYKISSEIRLKEAAKEYVKLYLRWKKLMASGSNLVH